MLEFRECFNWTRCLGRPFRIFNPDKFLATKQSTGKFYRIFLQTLEPYTIYEHPEDACLFLPSFDPTGFAYNRQTITDFRTQKTHLWNDGINHLLLNMEDQSLNYMLEDSAGGEYFDRAIFISSSAATNYRVRNRFDMTIPLISTNTSTWFLNHVRKGCYNDSLITSNKKWLMSFKGVQYPWIGTIRNRLASMKFENDSMIVTKCTGIDMMGGYPVGFRETTQCDKHRDLYDTVMFEELMDSSVFALCPRGIGRHSFRLLEAMVAGAIPVILSDGYALPFAPEIDMSQCAIVYPEDQLQILPKFLRSITKKERMERLEACRTFTRWMFRCEHPEEWNGQEKNPSMPLRQIFTTAIEVLKRRLHSMREE